MQIPAERMKISFEGFLLSNACAQRLPVSKVGFSLVLFMHCSFGSFLSSSLTRLVKLAIIYILEIEKVTKKTFQNHSHHLPKALFAYACSRSTVPN